MEATKNRTIDYALLCDRIAQSKCVLLIGPEFNMADEKTTMKQDLLQKLMSNDKNGIKDYRDQEEIFVFEDIMSKIMVAGKITDYYEKMPPADMHKKIVQIPFHFILSINPDLLLKRAFLEFGLQDLIFDFYFNKEQPKDFALPPKKDKPCLYNLFGSIEQVQSLILTHADLFDYIFAILGKHKLPVKLKTAIQNARSFIFLGFQFDKWYVQMLLHLLELNNKDFAHYAFNMVRKPEVEQFVKDEYQIQFVDNNISEFVENLYKEVQKQGILRKKSEISDIILKYVADNQLAEAIQVAKDYFAKSNDEDLIEDIKTFSRQYNRNMEGVVKGQETEEVRVSINRIKQNFTEKIKEIFKIQ